MHNATTQSLAHDLRDLFSQCPQAYETDTAVGNALRLLTQSIDLQERMHRLRLPDRSERRIERPVRPDGIAGSIAAFDDLLETLDRLTEKGVIDAAEAQVIAADARRRITSLCESLVQAIRSR